MIVKKRNGSKEDFDFDKIVKAVSAASKSSGYTDEIDLSELDRKFTDLSLDHDENYEIGVDEIHKIVEEFLFSKGLEKPYQAYILERNRKDTILAQDSYLIKGISEKLMAKDVQNQNANVDEYSFGGRIGEASRYVTKDYALNYCMSKKARKNHENNEIYIHDLDSYSVGLHNCLSIPFDELLSRGFVVRQTDVRPANSINTACQLVAVIFQVQSLQQFGGVSATHLDWTLVPYFRKSFFKHFSDHYIESCFDELKDGEDLDEFKKRKREEFRNKYNIQEEKYTIGDFSMDCVDFHVDDQKVKDINPTWYKCAYYETLGELKQAIEGMYHNLNTLQSRSGNQLPFTSINYGTCTLEEGRLIIKALLEGSIKGVGKFHRTPIFPCSIFQCMKGVNRAPGDPNYDLYKLALKSTSLRLYPNYANVDWSGNAGYDKNNPRTYFSTMGCHAKDTKIIMSDGTWKPVQNIAVGDKIMGVNNEIRIVQSLIKGNGRMFEITQSRGETYTVNEGHILSLEYSISKPYKGLHKGDRINISVHDFMQLPKSVQKHLKGYRSGYDLPDRQFDIPPYILGLWLGDGYSLGTRFSVNIKETQILDDLSIFAKSIDKKVNITKDSKNRLCVDIVDITNSEKANNGNKFRRALKSYNLIGNKHIPNCYFYGSYQQRSDLLAGLINTDGWAKHTKNSKTVCFGNTNLDLIKDVKKLANSLGYSATIIKARGETIDKGICKNSKLKPYYHVNIQGFNNDKLMPNKKCNFSNSKRNFNTSTINIKEVTSSNFYGFELDGDKLYLINDGTVTHNCRTANGLDINALPGQNPQMKDGRGNICPVTVILPTLAMEAGRDVEKFMRLLGRKIEEAKDMLIERFNWIASQDPRSATFMWQNGTMFGYDPKEGPISALRHGTLALGQLGLAECLELLIGTDQSTEEGMKLAKRIEGLFKKRCAEYKEKYKLNFGVYYTPAENLCYTALKKFRQKYGVIPDVSDREFFTNSIHIPVWRDMDPFEKIDLESQLTGYSSAGCITYVELPSTTKNNIEALETIVNYAMDHDIPYFAVNVPNDTCNDCGYQDEINDKCPQCGSTHISRLRRVTGYLTGDYTTAFNLGKQDEVRNRVKHIKH